MEFQKTYPDIKVLVVRGRSSGVASRIMAERRAGKYIVDLYNGGVSSQYSFLYKSQSLAPISDLFLLAEVVDRSKWFGKTHFADPEGKYIFPYIANADRWESYHVDFVNPKEFRSHWDLLNPKWIGKIVSLPPTSVSLGGWLKFLYYHPQLGPDFIKQFYGTMEISYSSDRRQMTDWLAAGKFAICSTCRSYTAKSQGLPVDLFIRENWKEGGSTNPGAGGLSYLDRAPHPNAAKVFVNWYLSRKGQMTLQRIGRRGDHPNSRRLDIPKDHVSPHRRLIPGAVYVETHQPAWQDMTPIFKLTRTIVGKTRGKSK